MIRWGVIAALIWVGMAQAEETPEPAFSTYPILDQVRAITDRLSLTHACAMDDIIEAELRTASFSQEAVEAVKSQGELQGEWTVLPSWLCEIRMPQVEPELAFSREDLEQFFLPHTPQEGAPEPGCFLNTERMWDMMAERGLSDDDANAQYLAFLSNGIRRNVIRFYSEDSLATPFGFLDTRRYCGILPYEAEMNRSYRLMVEHFDTYIRRNAAAVPCDSGANLMAPSSAALWDELTEAQNSNAWLAFEVHIVALGAGWFEGVSYRDKGTPRPPLCHYP